MSAAVPPPPSEEPPFESSLVNNSHKGLLRNIVTVNFFYSIFQESFQFMLPLYGVEKGWVDEYYGLVLAIGGYAAMIITFILGLFVDIQFKRTAMIIGLIATLASAVLFT